MDQRNIFALCIKAFGNVDRLRGGEEYLHFGRRLLTYEADSYEHPSQRKTCRLRLISLYVYDKPTSHAPYSTIVVADHVMPGCASQVSTDDIPQVLSFLYNHKLITDAEIQACLAYHDA